MTPVQFIDFFMDFGYEFRHKRHQSDLEFFVLDTHVGASCRYIRFLDKTLGLLSQKIYVLTLWIYIDALLKRGFQGNINYWSKSEHE